MNHVIAYELLAAELAAYRNIGFHHLRALFGESISYRKRDGIEYEITVTVRWRDLEDGDIRVIGVVAETTWGGPHDSLEDSFVVSWPGAAEGRGMCTAEARICATILGCGAAASIVFFWAIYGPALLSAVPGSSFRPMAVLPVVALMFGYVWWVVCIAIGVRLLFVRPRRYGWLTIGLGALQFAAVPLAMALLMRARGVEWGS